MLVIEDYYCIMQIIHGGKHSRLQCLVEICGKAFAVVLFMQYLLTSLVIFSLENFCCKTSAVAS